ncbi:uncharacterized protein [Parasteatoda tepidariorum]|uniref:uncharacterized protein n=1 Tax=Parasteatoda tepidariorum TaxID=114398 RepID=UPI001C72692E|nr:polyadenylate-binding protein 1-like [Parasteatoda tepidariorum]
MNEEFNGKRFKKATELDVKQKLSIYGTIKAVRIIRDGIGVSKRYGFVTFNLEDDAKKAMEKNEIILKGRKLHVAPAVKKKNNYSETSTDHSSEAYSLEKYPVSSRSYEYRNSRMQEFKQFDHSSGNDGFPQFSNFYMESGQCYGLTDMISPYGNPQMNLLSYPTLVYVPQQALQYAGTTAPIYLGASVPEVLQLIPASMCCINRQ